MPFEYIFYSFCLLLSVVLSLRSLKPPFPDLIGRILRVLIFPTLLSLTTLFLYKVLWSIYYDMNWERLFTALALARGYTIYPFLDEGPALVSLYGPVSVLAYLPATFASTPSLAMRMAEALCLAFFFLPPLWLHLGPLTPTLFLQAGRGNTAVPLSPEGRREGEGKGQGERSFRFFIFLCFAYFPFLVSSLRTAAFNIHADAPTLGLAALACGVLYFRKDKEDWMPLFASAFFAVLSVWSKQVSLPLLMALPLYVGLADGRKAFLRYLACLAICGLTLCAAFIWAFDFQRLFLNLVVIPARQPLKEGGSPAAWLSAFLKLFRELLLVLPFGLFAFRTFFLAKGGFLEKVRRHRWGLFFFVGILMIPMSLLAYVKIGGSNNTLSFVTYFLLLGSTLAWAHGPQDRLAIRAAAVLGTVFLAIQIPSVYYRIAVTPRQSDFAQIAYDYMKKYPGEAYFPRFGVLSLMAENKVYHSSVAIKDRFWAGYPISVEHFKAHIPEKIRLVAFHHVTADDMPWLHLADFSVVSSEDELPGYYLFKRPALHPHPNPLPASGARGHASSPLPSGEREG